MNMIKKSSIIIRILLIVMGIIGILYLSLCILLRYALSDAFEPLNIYEGYFGYDTINEYFYTNKTVFDAIDTTILLINKSNPDDESDEFSAQQQYIKQIIDSLSVRLPSKPENFAVCVKKNEIFITMGSGCVWQGWCSRRGYMWTPISFSDTVENESLKKGVVFLDTDFYIRNLSGKWFYYVYDRLNDNNLAVECRD